MAIFLGSFGGHWEFGVFGGGVVDHFGAVQGEKIIAKQCFHSQHSLFDAVGFELAFPDDDDVPAVFL